MRYEEGGNSASIGPISASLDHWERHLVVPFGWVEEEVRSRGLRVMMGDGREGLVDPAISRSSRMRSTD